MILSNTFLRLFTGLPISLSVSGQICVAEFASRSLKMYLTSPAVAMWRTLQFPATSLPQFPLSPSLLRVLVGSKEKDRSCGADVNSMIVLELPM